MMIVVGIVLGLSRSTVRRLPLPTFQKSKIVNSRAITMAHFLSTVAMTIIVDFSIPLAQVMIEAWGGIVVKTITIVTTITASTTTCVIMNIIFTAVTTVVAITIAIVTIIDATEMIIVVKMTVAKLVTEIIMILAGGF